VSSVFSGGGEKPPEIIDTTGQDEEDDAMVPGFSYGGSGGGGWWSKEEEGPNGPLPSSENGPGRRGPAESGGGEDFIPGFGASESLSSVASKQSVPLPSQQELMFGGSGADDWHRDRGVDRGGRDSGAGGRGSRWGPRRGGRY
jgi:polyadenylation factor subunit 2